MGGTGRSLRLNVWIEKMAARLVSAHFQKAIMGEDAKREILAEGAMTVPAHQILHPPLFGGRLSSELIITGNKQQQKRQTHFWSHPIYFPIPASCCQKKALKEAKQK